jgi:hypothetical protein
MGKHVDWITYEGKRILFVNVADLNEAEYIAGLEEMKQELLRDRTAPLVLIDLTKTAWTPATVDKAKEVAGAIKKAGIGYGPNSIVGLTKLQKSVADLSVRLVFYADSIEEAKDWLVKQDEKRRQGDLGLRR